MTSMSTSSYFHVFAFLLSSLVTGPSFLSIPLLVLELWQFLFIRDWPFLFIRDWPEIQKSEIPLSEFYPISGDWGKLGIPNLPEMFLKKRYLMLQNSRFLGFSVSKLLRENQQRRQKYSAAQIRIKTDQRLIILWQLLMLCNVLKYMSLVRLLQK